MTSKQTRGFVPSDVPNAQFYFSIKNEINTSVKRPVRIQLTDGPGITGPIDIANRHGEGRFEGHFWNVPHPMAGDPYTFDVEYADTTSEIITTRVTAVLDSFAVPVSPILSNVPGGTRPTFEWSAPPAPPPVYFYELEVHSGYENIWGVWDRLPSTVTSVEYNFDGEASVDPLLSGTVYSWYLHVLDEQGNRAAIRTEFTTP